MVNAWRKLGDTERIEFLSWVQNRTASRNQEGRIAYGDVFVGDPVEHAIEEALDLLFYLWVASRRMAHMNDGTNHL